MNILVTGGAGFIGSHLCEALAKRGGARIISLDDYSTGSTNNEVDGVEYRRGHTRDIARLVPEPLDLIVHLGEYSRVEASFAHCGLVLASNFIGTTEVLERWQSTGAKLVYAGSSTRFAIDSAYSPYAESKRYNVDRVINLGRRADLPWAVTYFYNVYGSRERAGETGTVIEKFRRQRLAGKHLSIVHPGTQRRNFTDVRDIIDGLLRVIDNGQREFAIGAAESYSVLEVAQMFGGPIEMLPERQGNRADSTIDTSAIESLGWRQRHRLTDYITNAVSELQISDNHKNQAIRQHGEPNSTHAKVMSEKPPLQPFLAGDEHQ